MPDKTKDVAARSRASIVGRLCARAVMCALGAGAAGLGACTSAPIVCATPLAEYAHAGSMRSDAVFDGPEGAWALEMAGGARALPEYARRDGDLALSEPGPILATNQWPQPEAPSLEDQLVYVYPAGGQGTGVWVTYQRAREDYGYRHGPYGGHRLVYGRPGYGWARPGHGHGLGHGYPVLYGR